MSPGNFDSTFIEAGENETKERFRVEKVTGESLGGTLLWLPRGVIEKNWAKAGLLLAHWIQNSETEVSQGVTACS